MACAHENMGAFVDVIRMMKSDDDPEVVGYSAEIRVSCVECDEAFVFVGAPIGMSPGKPCISPDGTELRAPLRPQTADPHFGLGLSGFIARAAEGSTASEN
jgi:hypothetical protein